MFRASSHLPSVGEQQVSSLVFLNDAVAEGAKAFWKKGPSLIHTVSVSVHIPSRSCPLSISLPKEKSICPYACWCQSVFSQVMWINSILGSSDLPKSGPLTRCAMLSQQHSQQNSIWIWTKMSISDKKWPPRHHARKQLLELKILPEDF